MKAIRKTFVSVASRIRQHILSLAVSYKKLPLEFL